MKFGVQLSNATTRDTVTRARYAEEQGFDLLTLSDTPPFRELYTRLGAVAARTDSVMVGPGVTNPLTRHPTVTANAMSTVHELSDGQAILGVGSGDSAVRSVGLSPARLDELEEFVGLFRRITRGESAPYNGEEVSIEWLRNENLSFDIPVMLAAAGPKTMRLGGRIADRVLIISGLHQGVIEDAVENVRAGAREVDRDPNEVEIWFFVLTNIDEDRRRAIDGLESTIAAVAHLLFQPTMEGKALPAEHRDAIETLAENYVMEDHVGQDDRNRNAELIDDLGLTSYLADRFCAVGSTDECRRKIESVAETGLVDGVLLSSHPSSTSEQAFENFLTGYGEEIMPAFD